MRVASAVVELLCLTALCVVGFILLLTVGPFCDWSNESRPKRGGFYEHP